MNRYWQTHQQDRLEIFLGSVIMARRHQLRQLAPVGHVRYESNKLADSEIRSYRWPHDLRPQKTVTQCWHWTPPRIRRFPLPSVVNSERINSAAAFHEVDLHRFLGRRRPAAPGGASRPRGEAA